MEKRVKRMNNLEQHLKEQTDAFLADCFNELKQWRESGVLEQGKVRNLHDTFNSNITQLHMISEVIYREIASRFVERIK